MDLRYRIMGLCLFLQHRKYSEIQKKKILQLITQAPWYVTNTTLHRDLRITPVREIFKEKAEAHYKTLTTHQNSLMGILKTPSSTRRLRRKWTFDAIT
jgi:hypothetical protein